ncbi:MAG: hypothetical protein ACRDX8_09610 [Acidimicrobiales bacterium]
MINDYIVTPSDRDAFVRCPRAWGFSSKTRQALEPVVPSVAFDLERAVRDALAVYYFPGMWTWNRGVVSPLVLQGFERSLRGQRKRYSEVADLGSDDEATLERYLEVGRDLLSRYMGWAPEYDLLWPLRVETDFDVHIPDAEHPGLELATPEGRAMHYQGRVDMLMSDSDDARWIVCHRLTEDAFTSVDLLRLDEVGLGCAWGWQNDNLIPITGVLYNELRLQGAPAFRRAFVARSSEEMAAFGARLSATAKEMVDPEVSLAPRPTPEHCSICAFKGPCLALNEGSDPRSLLSSDYRQRPEDEWVEGRLGSMSWSMSRGAAPPRFDKRA